MYILSVYYPKIFTQLISLLKLKYPKWIFLENSFKKVILSQSLIIFISPDGKEKISKSDGLEGGKYNPLKHFSLIKTFWDHTN